MGERAIEAIRILILPLVWVGAGILYLMDAVIEWAVDFIEDMDDA